MLNYIANAFDAATSFALSITPDAVKDIIGVTPPGIKLNDNNGMIIDMTLFGNTHASHKAGNDSFNFGEEILWKAMSETKPAAATTADVVSFPDGKVMEPSKPVVAKAEEQARPQAGNVRIVSEPKDGVPGFMIENNLVSIYLSNVENIPSTLHNGICSLNHREFDQFLAIIQGSPEAFQLKLINYENLEKIIDNHGFDTKTTAEFKKSLSRTFKTMFTALVHGSTIQDAVESEALNLQRLTEEITGVMHRNEGGVLTAEDLQQAVKNLSEHNAGVSSHRRNRTR